MLIDTNAYLGPFAFRQLRHNTADGLLKLMDAKGIAKAWVSNAAAITYRNVQPANEELAEAVRKRRDRLVPLAVINPFYAGWQDDLTACRKQLGMIGLRLYPKWHNYNLTDGCCLDLVDAATSLRMFITIPLRVEDYRQRSWLVDVKDLTLSEIAPLIRAKRQARFVLLNGMGFTGSPLGKKDGGLPPNYWIEISRLSALMANEIGALVEALGADRVVFGTGMPFNAPDPALVKMEVLQMSLRDKERIRWQNAAALEKTAQ
ncbi:MAG: amidohydrolase [Verrucomicrobiae bacterium]|nr:amidohydrolase [Verrucomicrobiae bacterium]